MNKPTRPPYRMPRPDYLEGAFVALTLLATLAACAATLVQP